MFLAIVFTSSCNVRTPFVSIYSKIILLPQWQILLCSSQNGENFQTAISQTSIRPGMSSVRYRGNVRYMAELQQ